MDKSFAIGCLIGIGVVLLTVYLMSKPQPRPYYEYQIILEQDSAYIYSDGKFIGSCPHGKDGIDSVLLKDNE